MTDSMYFEMVVESIRNHGKEYVRDCYHESFMAWCKKKGIGVYRGERVMKGSYYYIEG